MKTEEEIENLSKGQKLLIYAILIYIVGIITQIFVSQSLMFFAIATIICGIVGIIKISDGLGYSRGRALVYCVLAFLPIICLLLFVSLSVKATKSLKENGYTVGLLGAKEKK